MNDENYKIFYNKPFIAGKELYYISQAVSNGHLSGDGEFTRRCHEWFEAELGCRKALLTHSCTGALEIAAILADIKDGDEIIMPSFTFVSTANAFVLRGGRPVFVDICSDSLNIDVKKVEQAITDRTKAIVCIHYAGVACDMDKLKHLAAKYDVMLIEDAAHALLSSYKGRYLGTIGDIGCLSFHETKNIISGEGGAILINDETLIDRAEIIREKGTNRKQFYRGQVDKYSWVDIGSSYLPSELVGAFLFAQLEAAEMIIAKRRSLFDLYFNGLKRLQEEGLIRLPFVPEGHIANGHLFYVLARSADERKLLIDHLAENGILAVFHYVPLHSSSAGIRYGRVVGSMDVTNDVSERIVRLPLYYEMNDKDVLTVIQGIEEFYKR